MWRVGVLLQPSQLIPHEDLWGPMAQGTPFSKRLQALRPLIALSGAGFNAGAMTCWECVHVHEPGTLWNVAHKDHTGPSTASSSDISWSSHARGMGLSELPPFPTPHPTDISMSLTYGEVIQPRVGAQCL